MLSEYVLKFVSMKAVISLLVVLISSLFALAQSPTQQIYETERAFEKMVAEKNIRAGFLEYLAPNSVMFFPEPANGRERYAARSETQTALTWNPILIDVSSNGTLGYSIGTSVFKPKGKDDTTKYVGHYLSVWVRQSDGTYRAVLDTGINHDTPGDDSAGWKSPADSGQEKNEKKLSAADSTVEFYDTAMTSGLSKAFKSYVAEDAVLMRDGNSPFFGKKAVVDFLKTEKNTIKYPKRRSFVEAANLAYVYGPYSMTDKSGKQVEHGNFIQVWRLRNGRWQIAVDMAVVIPEDKK